MAWELASVGDIKIIDTDKIKAIINITVKQSDAIKRVRELHVEEYSEITNKYYCSECQYDYPCRTILIVGEQ